MRFVRTSVRRFAGPFDGDAATDARRRAPKKKKKIADVVLHDTCARLRASLLAVANQFERRAGVGDGGARAVGFVMSQCCVCMEATGEKSVVCVALVHRGRGPAGRGPPSPHPRLGQAVGPLGARDGETRTRRPLTTRPSPVPSSSGAHQLRPRVPPVLRAPMVPAQGDGLPPARALPQVQGAVRHGSDGHHLPRRPSSRRGGHADPSRARQDPRRRRASPPRVPLRSRRHDRRRQPRRRRDVRADLRSRRPERARGPSPLGGCVSLRRARRARRRAPRGDTRARRRGERRASSRARGGGRRRRRRARHRRRRRAARGTRRDETRVALGDTPARRRRLLRTNVQGQDSARAGGAQRAAERAAAPPRKGPGARDAA